MYRKSTRQRVALAALLALTATIVTLDFRQNSGGPIARIQAIAISVVAPLQDGMSRVFRPVGDFLSGLGEIGGLRAENKRLQREVADLKKSQRRFPEVARQNELYQRLLEKHDWTTGKTIGATVIGVGPSNQEWTAFIDKGEAEGLRKDMAVVSAEGLVGRVTFVAPHDSKILMVIDPQHSVGARLTNSGETGALSGRGDEDLKLDLIDPGTQIALGETVVTSGYDKGIYPPGIPIGRVTKVNKSKDGLTETALIRPFVDFTRLDTVLVLLESGPAVSPGA